jgi:RNA polymerase sigma-70 factor (ECF subfamily)
MIEETLKFNQMLDLQNLNTNKEAFEITDAEIVKQILAGDESYFNLLFDRYKKLVIHLIGKFFNQRELIEDITQQVFTKTFFSLKDFRGEQEKSLQSWISKLTINVCYDELRRRQRKPENLFTDLSDDEIDYVETIAENISSNSEKQLINKDLAEKLLSSLDAKDRLALTLYHAEEHSVTEVAKMVGWTESNVKTRLMRTRNHLRNLFERIS